MKIDHIHIRNFRKLKNCRIDFDEKQTIFVGANNSGKTSAMSAIVWFLKYKDRFTTREFTLTNWAIFNRIGNIWVKKGFFAFWDSILPSIDVWIRVPEYEAYKVYNIIPSLDWQKDMVGVRLRFEPKDIINLYNDYTFAYQKAAKQKTESKNYNLKLFPENIWDFLNYKDNLRKYFEVKYYVLDSRNIIDDKHVQSTPTNALDDNPLSDLIRIDTIEASRDFTDPEGKNDNDIDTLSKQLQNYYKVNFDDDNDVLNGDWRLIDEISKANKTFDKKLERCFASPITELKNINYPGFQNPNIIVKSVIRVIDSITHDSSVLFAIQGKSNLSLPEKYNGLGLRNLISMYLKLVQFREQWVNPKDKKESTQIEPIHLVFIEEPEAHLHAQAQQVFIRKARMALTDNKVTNGLTTQLVVTTHSSHIVNEVDMNCLRYFKRILDANIEIPVSTVENLSSVFGKSIDDTRNFVSRYIKLTHCDIFFADAVILVEGSAERILMPKFIKNVKDLDCYYISVIEVNGSHAHRFRSLLERLSIPALIVTDLDSQELNSKGKYESSLPKIGNNQQTNNDSIKEWLNKSSIDELLKSDCIKQIQNVRLAYQTGIKVKWDDKSEEQTIYPYTFEDSFIFTNLSIFESVQKGKGAVTTFYNYKKKASCFEDFHTKVFHLLESNGKVKSEFANTLLLDDDYEKINTPEYIKEGLIWLKEQLDSKNGNKNGK